MICENEGAQNIVIVLHEKFQPIMSKKNQSKRDP